MAARAVIPRGSAQSYESRKARRESDKDSRFLGNEERAELLYAWGGYGSAVGSCRSACGAILDAALRAPPREKPVWGLVEDELTRVAGRMPIEKLVEVIALEGMATRHEVRRAVDAMVHAHRLELSVEAVTERRDSFDADGNAATVEVDLPTALVKLLPRPKKIPPERMTPAERWSRNDETLRAYCRGVIPCHETRTRRGYEPITDINIGALGHEYPVPALTGLHRVVLERVYGTSHHPAHQDIFGQLAGIVVYTGAAAEARRRLDGENRTTEEAVHATLDEAPAVLAQLVPWRERRERFIAQVKREAEAMLAAACEAYRKAKR